MNVRRVSSRVSSVILPMTLFVLLSLLLAACQPIQRPAPDAAPAEEVAALPAAIPLEWDGTLEVTGITMRFLVSLAQGADGWSGLIDVPQQGMSDLPLHHVTIAPPAFHFEMLEGESAATFDGTLAADGTVSGEFVQGPYAGTFQMAPLVAEPVVEKPYLEEEVTVPSGEHTLAGTLSMPAGDGPFPALILVSGSGPQNRNEEIPAVTGYAPFAEIADRLTREGFAVLRYDDRGVGASTGDFASATTADFADALERAAQASGVTIASARAVATFVEQSGAYKKLSAKEVAALKSGVAMDASVPRAGAAAQPISKPAFDPHEPPKSTPTASSQVTSAGSALSARIEPAKPRRIGLYAAAVGMLLAGAAAAVVMRPKSGDVPASLVAPSAASAHQEPRASATTVAPIASEVVASASAPPAASSASAAPVFVGKGRPPAVKEVKPPPDKPKPLPTSYSPDRL